MVPDLSWQEEEEEEEEEVEEEEEEEESPQVPPPRGPAAKKGHAAKVPSQNPAPQRPSPWGGDPNLLPPPPNLFLSPYRRGDWRRRLSCEYSTQNPPPPAPHRLPITSCPPSPPCRNSASPEEPPPSKVRGCTPPILPLSPPIFCSPVLAVMLCSLYFPP